MVYQTSEVPNVEELEKLEAVKNKLGEIISFVDEADKSWYKFGREDIMVIDESADRQNVLATPLSTISSVVGSLKAIKQRRIYVPKDRKTEASLKLND